uniref:Uncharacterized protein n=1 Tax=Setaria digitata TaxID=48799 RepID=A0A915PGT9_9BILA
MTNGMLASCEGEGSSSSTVNVAVLVGIRRAVAPIANAATVPSTQSIRAPLRTACSVSPQPDRQRRTRTRERAKEHDAPP